MGDNEWALQWYQITTTSCKTLTLMDKELLAQCAKIPLHCCIFTCRSFHTCKGFGLLNICQHRLQRASGNHWPLGDVWRGFSSVVYVDLILKKNNLLIYEAIKYFNSLQKWKLLPVKCELKQTPTSLAVKSIYSVKKSMLAIWLTISCLSLQPLAEDIFPLITSNSSVHPLSLFNLLTAILLNQRKWWKENQ